ncbi:hypothetical protein D3C87_1745250 [compost metagenome]
MLRRRCIALQIQRLHMLERAGWQVGKCTEFQVRQVEYRRVDGRAIALEHPVTPTGPEGVCRPDASHHLFDIDR